MFSVILISHAAVSSAMIDSARMVMGKLDGLYSLEVMPGDSPDEIGRQLESLLAKTHEKGEVVLLSDFPLGTPFNLGCSLSLKYPFRHLTGMSLPLLISLLKNRKSPLPLDDVCKEALEQARAQTFDVNEYLKELSS